MYLLPTETAVCFKHTFAGLYLGYLWLGPSVYQGPRCIWDLASMRVFIWGIWI